MLKLVSTVLGEKPRKMKQRCFHDLLAAKGAFEIQQEAVGLSRWKERLIRGQCRGAPATERAQEICAMGNNSDDGKPRPKVIGGFLKRWEGIRAYWYESEGGKLVVVEVVGGHLKEGENLD